MPTLVTISLLTTPWGWLFDQTLLAVPIIALAAKYASKQNRLPRNVVLAYTVLNITLLLLAMASSPWSFLLAPSFFAFLLYRDLRRAGAISSDVQHSYIGSHS